MLSLPFAVGSEPLASEKLFSLGPLVITNSILLGLICAAFLLSLFLVAARASQLWPKSKLAFYVETIVETVFDLMSETFGDSRKAMKQRTNLIS